MRKDMILTPYFFPIRRLNTACQDLKSARIKGMKRICETELVSILSRKPWPIRTGVSYIP